ncbi:hypothetical protein BDV97DRAFT_373994 [Delphinella strobiligena]|nr:hypothetical protein BDV97DRAFT_373994 [Delphinella strobiligena]
MVPATILAVWESSTHFYHNTATATVSSASSHQHAIPFSVTFTADDTERNLHTYRATTPVQESPTKIARSLAARSEANADRWTPAAAVALYYQWEQTHAPQGWVRDNLHIRWVGVMDLEAQQVDDPRHEVVNWLRSKLELMGITLFGVYATFCNSCGAGYDIIKKALFDLSTALLSGCAAMYR